MANQSTSRKTGYFLVYVLYVLLLTELASRLYLVISEGGNFFSPEEILYEYYPKLGDLKEEHIGRDEEYFDILFLGGSVLNPEWGQIEGLLLRKVSNETNREVRIHNLSEEAHTSLDSFHKYRSLADKRFDLVFVYHGINEVRANNSSDEVFKDDYSHYMWYRWLNLIERHTELEYIALPYAIERGFMGLRDRFDPPEILPRNRPKARWAHYGSSVKTAIPLASNLQKMIDISVERGEPILLATFAFHVPKNYSLGQFAAKTLNYGNHQAPIELWGEPRNVITALLTHNRVIRDAARARNVMFVDMDRAIPNDGEHFDDICHLTYAGSEEFANRLLPFVDRALEEMEARESD